MSSVLERPSPTSSQWLVDSLLREQQELSAVLRFSDWHEGDTSGHESYYRELIPLTQPGPGEQYAFEVDLDTCSGCKACVTACHSLNGLEEKETWRSVGSLHDVTGDVAVLKYVTTACHHCVEPACLQGCPTKAYEKDPVTGIVRHLDDQCFGCQYCVLMCPYEVPKYSVSKGIVRKCDMCRQRLGQNEAPACVQACPNQAIKIKLVPIQEVRARAAAQEFLPDSPDPRITLPTTRYKTRHKLTTELNAGDEAVHHPAHAHWPLVFMLVLTQMSVGIELIGYVMIEWLGWLPANPGRLFVNVTAALIGFIGANLAALHLGRPLIAYRAWLGWRTSWLSREVLAFGAYVPLLLLTAIASWPSFSSITNRYLPFLELATVIAGMMAVFCSAMIYIATRRPWWNARRTLTRFAFTVFLLGNATATAIAAFIVSRSENVLFDYRYVFASLALSLVVVLWRIRSNLKFLMQSSQDENEAIRGTGQLLADRPLRYAVRHQRAWAVGAAIGLPLLAIALIHTSPDTDALRMAVAGILLVRVLFVLMSEITERYLFFAASVSPRMPGGISS